MTMSTRWLMAIPLTLSVACGPKQSGTYAVGAASAPANVADPLLAEADALW